MTTAKCLGLVVLLTVCAEAQPAKLRIDADRLMSTVTLLAEPKFEGRAAGSPGGIAARGVIGEKFRLIGLEPVGGVYLAPLRLAGRSRPAQK